MAKSKTKAKGKGGGDRRTYKLIELVGTSKKGFEDAVGNAVADASATVKGLSWFEVVESRGHIVDGKVAEYQVKVKVAFRILHGS